MDLNKLQNNNIGKTRCNDRVRSILSSYRIKSCGNLYSPMWHRLSCTSHHKFQELCKMSIYADNSRTNILVEHFHGCHFPFYVTRWLLVMLTRIFADNHRLYFCGHIVNPSVKLVQRQNTDNYATTFSELQSNVNVEQWEQFEKMLQTCNHWLHLALRKL